LNLQPLLAPNTDEDTGIPYENFLDKFQLQASKGSNLNEKQTAMLEILCSRCSHLGAILYRMDREGTGAVSVADVTKIFRLMGQRFPDARALFVEKPEDILSLLEIHPSADGTIPIESFVNAFRVKADWIAEQHEPANPAFVPKAKVEAESEQRESKRPSDPRAVFKMARLVSTTKNSNAWATQGNKLTLT